MEKPEHLHFIREDHDHRRCLARALTDAEQICRRHGQRFTTIRRRVFELVWQQHKPIGAYQVLEALQKEGRAAPPTVYRALDFLRELGLVHRIASLNAYVGCVQPERTHQGQFLICSRCGAFAELDAAAIDGAIAASARESGFEVHRHTIEIMGLCPHCQSPAPSVPESGTPS